MNRTEMRCSVRVMNSFKAKVGLHLESTLILILLLCDGRLTDEIRQDSPWTIYTDGQRVCCRHRDQVEENLKRWRYALDRRVLNVNCRKTE